MDLIRLSFRSYHREPDVRPLRRHISCGQSRLMVPDGRMPSSQQPGSVSLAQRPLCSQVDRAVLPTHVVGLKSRPNYSILPTSGGNSCL
ncbi:unnamed protein product [Nezara viridula]|uniref:Uncharacterized protein n=1 Tax=Nezara viridula TaxID=85310 RepID=A0A9P0EB35_NEZVI|nr:unnamed protein product [Nezara viridula]